MLTDDDAGVKLGQAVADCLAQAVKDGLVEVEISRDEAMAVNLLNRWPHMRVRSDLTGPNRSSRYFATSIPALPDLDEDFAVLRRTSRRAS
jgi:hypothetical protein